MSISNIHTSVASLVSRGSIFEGILNGRKRKRQWPIHLCTHIPNVNTQNYPFCRLVVKTFGHQLNKPTNKNSLKVTRVLKPTNKKMLL